VDYHESNTCEHVDFALNEPDVQKIMKQKRKDGWKVTDTT